MLSIRNLSKTYANGVHALINVNLDIGCGMFGLLGPNGAGKSSLMRTLATLQEPDSGSVMLGEIDVLKEKDRVRRVLGYLPQEFGVYPRVSAEELLTHIAVLKGIADKVLRRAMVHALLEQTNLWSVRGRFVHTFSGGMKQRFGIAQALLGQPQLIIVDEPTAGLDPAERNRFHSLLAEIGENVVVILSTHIVEDVSDLCTQLAVLAGGHILLQGAPDTVIETLRGKLWRKLMGKTELFEAQQSLPVISTRLSAGTTVVHVLSDSSPGAGFASAEPDLEDVYFSTLYQHGQRGALAA